VLPNNVNRDPNLTLISKEIAENVPAKSIFLCGSRATGQGVNESSDYDLGVVMNTMAVPLYYRRLKRLERTLSLGLEAEVVINPLPTLRLKHAKGNYFLFKLKREAVTLRGEDISGMFAETDIGEISSYWYFSYYFSAVKELIRNFSSTIAGSPPPPSSHLALAQDAAKALLHCSELLLLINHQYETDQRKMVLRLEKISFPGLDRAGFIEDAYKALDIRRGRPREVDDPLSFWFRVKRHLVAVLRILIGDYKKRHGRAKLRAFWTAKDNARLKNWQYFAMTMLRRHKFVWRSLISGSSVEERVWLALSWLLLAVDDKGNTNGMCVARGYEILKPYMVFNHPGSEPVSWDKLREAIMECYPLACTVMGA